jgi:DNA polymerase elongation subunit (family B)
MEDYSFFPYSWYIDTEETEVTVIRAYGLDDNNENVCVQISDFKPYVYLELPNDIKWD